MLYFDLFLLVFFFSVFFSPFFFPNMKRDFCRIQIPDLLFSVLCSSENNEYAQIWDVIFR